MLLVTAISFKILHELQLECLKFLFDLAKDEDYEGKRFKYI